MKYPVIKNVILSATFLTLTALSGGVSRFEAFANEGVLKGDDDLIEAIQTELGEMFPKTESSISFVDEDEPIWSDRERPKRYAILFSQTHTYDYETGEAKEDTLFRATFSSMGACYTAVVESGYFDVCVVLAGEKLIKANVYGLFDRLAEETREGDELFIYWNGHAATGLPDDSGDEKDGFDECLKLFETTNALNGEDSAKSLRETTVVDDELGDLFRRLEGRKITAIFETCHSEGFLSSSDRALTSFDSFLSPGSRITADSLADFAFQATDEARRRASEYKRALDVELNKIGRRYLRDVALLPCSSDEQSSDCSNEEEVEQTSDCSVEEEDEQMNDSSVEDEDEQMNDSSVEDEVARLLEELFYEGSKSYETNERRDLDETAYNLVFSSQTDEASYPYTEAFDDAGYHVTVEINPVALALVLSLRNAKKNNVQLTFQDFVNVVDSVVKNDYSTRLLTDENGARKRQTPVFRYNIPDLWLYSP